jgi:hypothetical protein
MTAWFVLALAAIGALNVASHLAWFVLGWLDRRGQIRDHAWLARKYADGQEVGR